MHSPAETELIKDVIIFLASMGTSVSEQLLIDFLEKTSDTVLRRETIWALARSSNQQALSFEHLIELFHSEHDMQNQKLILWLIGRTASPHEVATFLESLDDSIHSSFQREIIWLMNDRSGQLSSDSLMDIISKSMYPRIRYEALWAMARVLDKKDLPRLVQLQNLEKDIQIKDEISKLIASI
jgi:HEAT repeat protein